MKRRMGILPRDARLRAGHGDFAPPIVADPIRALPVNASQANETLHDVLPVERRFNGLVGGFLGADLANAGESGARIDGASGSVASRHAAATTRIDPARAHESDCRSANM